MKIAQPGLSTSEYVEILRRSPHPGERHAAAMFLRNGPKPGEVIEALVEALGDEGVDEIETGEGGPPLCYAVAEQAAGSLGVAGDAAVPFLLRQAGRASPLGRGWTARLLAGRSGEPVRWLVGATRDEDASVASAAAKSLGEAPATVMGDERSAGEVVAALAGALLDARYQVARAAAQALGKLGASSPAVGPRLERWLAAHPTAADSLFSIVAQEQGTRSEAAVEALLSLPIPAAADRLMAMFSRLRDGSLRYTVLYALRRRGSELGPVGRRAVLDLLGTGPNDMVIAIACEAGIPRPDLVRALEGIVTSGKHDWAVAPAREALRKLT